MPMQYSLNQKSQNQEQNQQTQNYSQNEDTLFLPKIDTLIKHSFSLIKKGFWRFVWINILSAILIPLGISAVIYGILYLVDKTVAFITLPIGLAIIFMFSYLWKYAVMINFSDVLKNNDERFIPFKKSGGYVLGLWVFGFVLGIIVNIGFLLLVIPGIIWLVKYYFTPYVYCLEEKRIFVAMGKSSEYTKGFIFSLLTRFLFFVIIFGLSWLLLWLVMIVVLPMVGVLGGGSLFALVGGGMTGLIAATPVILILLLAYLIIFTLVEVFQIVYFYNIFDSLRKIKQQNPQATDNYSIGKKILVLIPIIALIVLFVLGSFNLLGNKKDSIKLDSNSFYSNKPSFDDKTKDKKLKISDIKQIQIGLEQYYNVNNGYPLQSTNIGVYGCLDTKNGFMFSNKCSQAILTSLSDFTHDNTIYYKSLNGGLSYRIDFEIEEADGEYDGGSHYATPVGIDLGDSKKDVINKKNNQEVSKTQKVNNDSPVNALDRDKQRIKDMLIIKNALDKYYDKFKSYPSGAFDGLLGKDWFYCLEAGDSSHRGFTAKEFCEQNILLMPVPRNPRSGGIEYIYRDLGGTLKDYKIYFSLEDGFDEYDPGIHFMTPQGIDNESNFSKQFYYDTDSDGLSDQEEENIWFTDKNSPDTDGDGYSDGDEVKNGYDPLVAGNAKLK